MTGVRLMRGRVVSYCTLSLRVPCHLTVSVLRVGAEAVVVRAVGAVAVKGIRVGVI